MFLVLALERNELFSIHLHIPTVPSIPGTIRNLLHLDSNDQELSVSCLTLPAVASYCLTRLPTSGHLSALERGQDTDQERRSEFL